MNLSEIFKRMCLIRYFESEVIEAVKNGFISCPVYLSIGQEAISSAISTLTKGYSIFAQHRAHSVYLAHGGRMEPLIDELLCKKTGCCQGKGGSPCIQDLEIKMFGHHGLIGENIPLAVGYSLATKEKTIAYFGDAAAEEDYSLSSMGFAATHKLPVLFVCENNNLSILTPIADRRNWKIADVAKAMNLPAVIIEDNPEIIYKNAEKLLLDLPAYIEVKTCRHFWHVGIGQDNQPEYDRLSELRGIIKDSLDIEGNVKKQVKKIWQERLQTL